MKGFLKKYFLLAAMAAYVFLAIASLAGGEHGINERKNRERTATSSATAQLYKIGVSRGRVTVFNLPGGEVVRRTEAQVSLLPEADRDRLERGITVEGKSDLRRTLEDICS